MKIKIENLYFAFNENHILKNINIEFEKSKVYSLLGKNGTGKTTLLKNLLGILKPSSGKISIGNRVVSDIKEKDLSKIISYVPQTINSNLTFDVLTMVLMGRNPYLNALTKPTKEDYELSYEAIRIVGIDKLIEKDFSKLSGGEKQLVMIARAIAQDTEFIVMDEPTSNLDIKNQNEVMNLIWDISRKYNKGIILSIHDPLLCYKYCDEGVMIKDGELMISGQIDDIFTEEHLSKLYDVEFTTIRGVNSEKIIVPSFTLNKRH
ncbi:iron (III) ABC transporter ATP-binding protein [Gottschalkia acidurici 9a]|uniref:Iron (III) ABC transporter ATP-binding protein n=1 Tax=Gottschalkia acidurici (strain ATCC 7906 / DSM 604 / BCRC 14475 / CIP 104303 / KCTC 5404 / NCIMB 10678 / 9a) TaxID=1128398 RepID=K0B4P6_GOTA9|nr:ABC transporter ATP-binding protein [Gottschalkia acidurici]AFS79541.1 iron (III) ABC transporter ATP-binding protein [Gottschalkia acidurici 9a]